MDDTIAALREELAANDSEHFRVVVDSLSGEHDVVEIAMAAVKLYHLATSADEQEGEAPAPQAQRDESKPRHPWRVDRSDGGTNSGDMVRIYIGTGKNAGVRPQDLVGAIANEA